MQISLLSRFRGAIFSPLCYCANQNGLSGFYLAACLSLINTGGISVELQQKLKDWQPENENSFSLALLLLPMFVFFHDNQRLLEEKLKEAEILPRQREQILVFAGAIAQAMSEKVSPHAFVGQLKKKFTWEPLKVVEQSLIDNGSLATMVANLSRYPREEAALALSLYCFVVSAESYTTAINLAKNTGSLAANSVMFTAAIAGSYNSHTAIPVTKRLALKLDDPSGALSGAINNLFLAWAGVDPTSAISVLDEAAVASFGIIQPRPSLKLISQETNSII